MRYMMLNSWYKKAQSVQDSDQILQEVIKFTKEVMNDFDQLQHYVTVVVPRRATEIARIATDPNAVNELIPALNKWAAEMTVVNQRLNKASTDKHAEYQTLRRQWEIFQQNTENIQIETVDQAAPTI